MNGCLKFLNLFAGGGGLSEGFIQAGFEPVAHVESERSACFTLNTRMAYHWMKSHDSLEPYVKYLNGDIRRQEFYQHVPEKVIKSVINNRIGDETLPIIFREVDDLLNNSKLDLIVGGPPCQAYSLVGRSRDKLKMKYDERNYLYRHYARFLEKYRPTYFVFENVVGLLSARDSEGRSHLETMRGLFSEHGYETEYKILSANEYGVLQSRKRVFLVGHIGKSEGFYPEPREWLPETNVEEIFLDLPDIAAGGGHPGPCIIRPGNGEWLTDAGIRNSDVPVTWHQARPQTDRDLEIYRIAVGLWNSEKSRLKYNHLPERLKTHNNVESFCDRFKVVASNLRYSHTVVAHIAKDGHYYIHPDLEQNRSITPREAARLQTFPDDYYFESATGTPARTPAFQQVGNAVPVLLARKIAERLRENWK